MFKWIFLFNLLSINFPLLFTENYSAEYISLPPSGTVRLTFRNVVEGHPMVLHNKVYTNSFGENYSINKFKYYVGKASLISLSSTNSDNDIYHLINQNDSASLSFSFSVKEGTYDSVFFLLGVDSLHNVSGAQTDALDPANDMFWTWNSGYVMAKMEGKSSASALNNIFEFHIGGFSGKYNVLKKIALSLAQNKLIVHQGRTSEVVIQADANAWWQGTNDVHISATPTITTPGIMAKKISDNYGKMFSIISVHNN